MKNHFILVAMAALLASCLTQQNESGNSEAISGDYFGQKPPGDSAILFAPGAVSSAMNERDFAITPDGTEIFFCREAGNYTYTTIFYSQVIDGIWTNPEVFEYCTIAGYKYIEPHISPDGKKMYFVSNMPKDSGTIGDEDIWVTEKIDGKWSKPFNPGEPVNSKSKEYFPSVTNNGTIYYTHFDSAAGDEFIYRSRFVNGAYREPEKLGPNVNIGTARFNAFVAADESYIIIPAYGMPDSYGGTDYYISFRDSMDNWSKPINMGATVNTSNPKEWSAAVTTDGKYLFFMSAKMGDHKLERLSRESMQGFSNSPQNGNTDIYWISTSIIEKLREQSQF